jgi:hypothetical protein
MPSFRTAAATLPPFYQFDARPIPILPVVQLKRRPSDYEFAAPQKLTYLFNGGAIRSR